MTFDEILEQVRELLQSKGRVAYRALKRRFELDDEYLEDLKAELIDAEHVAHDEDGKVLVWIGTALASGSTSQAPRELMKKGIKRPHVLGRLFVLSWRGSRGLFSVALAGSRPAFSCTTQARI